MEIKTKFNLGDTVWCLFNQKAIKFEIKKILASCSGNEMFSYIMYGADEISSKIEVEEKDVYSSKEELKKAIFDEENTEAETND